MYNTETLIVEESIYVRFDDKLDPKKSKLVENFADLEITFSDSKGDDTSNKDPKKKYSEQV